MEEDNRVVDAWKNERLNACKINEFKEYLRSVGQHVSENKADLIERMKGACKLNNGNVFKARESDIQDTRKKRMWAVEHAFRRNPCSSILIGRWSDDLSKIPDLSEKDIYNYFCV
jgi:hypothetical protein